MQNRFLLGVSVGEAFAEYTLLEGTKVVATKRAYLSRESLKSSLQQFVTTHSENKISKAAISLRVQEKLLDYNLNGAVAHITTEGLEHWLELHKCAQNTFTTADLQFSLRERIHADGSVGIAMATDELEAIAAKLEMVGTKKVCLHLMHASVNSVHETAATKYLTGKGFEVFVPAKTDNADEVSRWKKNALNATVSALYSDLKKDLEAALQGVVPAEHIHYLTAQGEFTQNIEHSPISALAAAYSALALSQEKKKRDVLYLGLENFALISSDNWKSYWQSPWGAVENKHIAYREVAVQPTLSIELNAFGHFDFNKQAEGWEPGPMLLGRGQKATLMDLWAENPKLAKVDSLQDRITAAGVQRFKNSLFAMSKASRMREKELPHVTKELQSLAIQKLAMESLLFRHNQEIIVTGPLADLFGNGFKKDAKATIEADEFAMSRAVALLGQSLLKG